MPSRCETEWLGLGRGTYGKPVTEKLQVGGDGHNLGDGFTLLLVSPFAFKG